ncbi:YncE family protein [Athalassotoga saccharophila]|uniref:YncE family protein n=1 Tax=Athalassotoga saccharophila TaxID=1441386 RepID=UPI00137A0A54|nr:hypothetical protein [Athalassotoga saccharophila]BBJ28361.1 hypothetical protein ATHSA_1274 [Athalassotoga saccharophila]
MNYTPGGIGIDQKTDTFSGDNTVSVISASTYELLKTIPVGVHPSSVAIDPKYDLRQLHCKM